MGRFLEKWPGLPTMPWGEAKSLPRPESLSVSPRAMSCPRASGRLGCAHWHIHPATMHCCLALSQACLGQRGKTHRRGTETVTRACHSHNAIQPGCGARVPLLSQG